MSETYQFDARDLALLNAATNLLKKVAQAETTRPAQLVSVAKVQHVLANLPRVTEGMTISVSVSGPRRQFGEIETRHWWNVEIEDERLTIYSGGHFYDPRTGGDTFTTMTWTAVPEEPSDFSDYRQSLRMVPDVRAFPEAVADINFAAGGYSVEVTDDDNPLLEEDADSEEDDAGEDSIDPGDDERDIEETDDESGEWSIQPLDAAEKTLAEIVDRDQVNANEPAYAYNVQNCDFCGCALGGRGLYVDGRLREDLMWGNMCAACFGERGEGIGWGNGQLYARQPDGKWRMVAGWRSSDAEA